MAGQILGMTNVFEVMSLWMTSETAEKTNRTNAAQDLLSRDQQCRSEALEVQYP